MFTFIQKGGKMKVEFAYDKQANMVNNYPIDNALAKYIRKKKCPAKPEDVLNTLNELLAAPTVADLPPMLNYHLLANNRSGTAAVDIRISGQGGRGAWRMVFLPVSNCDNINQQRSIDHIVIEELVEDYHK